MLLPYKKPFYKTKAGLEIISLPHFQYGFPRKMFFLLYSINSLDFIDWLPLLHEILSHMCLKIVCSPGCDVKNFEVILIFLSKSFFLHDQKVKTKMQISWERKKLSRWNKKHFSSFLKGFYWRRKNKLFGNVRVRL